MPLRTGAFQFGPLDGDADGRESGVPEAVSFELLIEPDQRIVARRGTEPLAIEGVAVTDPVVVLPGDVIQLATDHFTVERVFTDPVSEPEVPRAEPRIQVVPARRRPVSNRRGWFSFWAAMTIAGLALAPLDIRWLGVTAAGLAGTVATWLVRRTQRRRGARQYEQRTTEAAAILTRDLQIERHAAARKLRTEIPGPAAITDRIASDTHLATEFDGRVALAAGDMSWSPPIEGSEDPGWDISPIVDTFDFLPAVPFVVDFNAGPIGIAGPRRAALAVARHLLTAAMAQTTPEQLAVITEIAPSRTDDWNWIESAPHHRAESPADAVVAPMTLRMVDGADTDRTQPGIIIVSETTELLNAPGATTLVISEDGTAVAYFGEGFVAADLVPNGITLEHTEALIEVLAAAAPPEDVGPLMAELENGTVIDLRDIPVPPESAAPDLPEFIDLTLVPSSYAFLADELVVIGEATAETLSYVASAALEQASMYPDRPLYILDGGDRALIRLAQLPTCERYTPIDDLPGTIDLVAALEAGDPDPDASGVLLVAPDLGPTLDFHRRSGEAELADRLEHLLERSSFLRVATRSADTSLEFTPDDDRFFVWIITAESGTDDPTAPTRDVRIVDQDGEHRMDVSNVPGRDLTASVADIKHRREHSPAGRKPT